jgi:hypothetical protein
MRASDDYVPPQRSVLERILIRSWEYANKATARSAWPGLPVSGVGGRSIRGFGLSVLSVFPAGAEPSADVGVRGAPQGCSRCGSDKKYSVCCGGREQHPAGSHRP